MARAADADRDPRRGRPLPLRPHARLRAPAGRLRRPARPDGSRARTCCWKRPGRSMSAWETPSRAVHLAARLPTAGPATISTSAATSATSCVATAGRWPRPARTSTGAGPARPPAGRPRSRTASSTSSPPMPPPSSRAGLLALRGLRPARARRRLTAAAASRCGTRGSARSRPRSATWTCRRSSARLPAEVRAGQHGPRAGDPGPMPEELLRIPGFVSEVMDLLPGDGALPEPGRWPSAGPWPSRRSWPAARSATPATTARTSTCWAWPTPPPARTGRARSTREILHAIGLADCLGDRVRLRRGHPGRPVPEPVHAVPDRRDRRHAPVDQQGQGRPPREHHEHAADDVLVGQQRLPHAAQGRQGGTRRRSTSRSLVLFGTAIPNHYYEALSERMLTNGFFARMIILEGGKRARGPGAEHRRAAAARVWRRPSGGRISGPAPATCRTGIPSRAIVEQTDEAKALLIETRQEAEAEYAKAEERQRSRSARPSGAASASRSASWPCSTPSARTTQQPRIERGRRRVGLAVRHAPDAAHALHGRTATSRTTRSTPSASSSAEAARGPGRRAVAQRALEADEDGRQDLRHA